MPLAKFELQGEDAIYARFHAGQEKLGEVSALVGYATEYAVYVHEDPHAHHPVGQYKYLEVPFRARVHGASRRAINYMNANDATLKEAIKHDADELMKESQALCPVDTGRLRDSAYAVIDF